MRPLVKKIVKFISIVLMGMLLIVFVFLYVNSPNSTPEFKNKQGEVIKNSIAEMKYIPIGGINQFILLRGKNKDNPVLLILHGGPGISELPMFRKYNSDLENYFTVAYWDQRGAGKSAQDSLSISTLGLKQAVEDTHAVTAYLKKKFKKNKIYVLGHSWGSLLGLKTIKKYPEDYLAFIGTGQFSNQPKSDSLSYRYVLNEATKLNDQKAINKLNEIGAYKSANMHESDFMNWLYYQRVFLSVFGGAIANKGKEAELFFTPTLYCKEYTMKEKYDLLKSNSKESFLNSPFKKMMMDVLKIDITKITKFNVPIYFIQGEEDYITNYNLAKSYFNTITAPDKRFFSFKNSGHFPPFEEPEKFNKILIQLLVKK